MKHTVIRMFGGDLILDPRKALIWPEEKSIFISDTHFGKSSIFRNFGLQIPEGSDKETLSVISGLIRDYPVKRLFILGDFVHGRLPEKHMFFNLFNMWKKSHQKLSIILVLGNHDSNLENLCLGDLEMYDSYMVKTTELVHDPQSATTSSFISGHVHPFLNFRAWEESLRMPIFLCSDQNIVLPAFGLFTGGKNVDLTLGQVAYAIYPDGSDIIRIPHLESRLGNS